MKHKFSLLDKDRSGRITTEELRQVFLNYQIFILGPTLMALVKKFEVDGGGVLHEPLATYLLGQSKYFRYNSKDRFNLRNNYMC